MKYLVYKRFKDKALCGEVNIPALTECDENNGIIFFKNKALCFITSENAHNHFVINDDGMGLERSNLIQSILSILKHKDEDYQNRWNKIWEDEVSQKYKRTEHQDHWLWNHDFFNADINDLKHILNLIRRKE